MTETPVVLETRQLVRHFPVTRGIVFKKRVGLVRAVDGVDLTLRRGETLGLVGESGCGKSTLARLVMALDKPTSGEVRINGRDPFALDRAELRELRRDIQIVLQDPYTALDPRMTVRDLLLEPYEVHPDVLARARRETAIRELVEMVGLDADHLNRYPHQFSGGQRQRIGIARALALRPKIVVCDEPVSALDVSVQAQVINLLKDLQAELGLSYIFIAHDLSVVRHVSDRVHVMYLGKFVESGTCDEVYEQAAHPYTQALHSAVAEPDVATRGLRRQIYLAGDPPSPLDPPSGCAFRTRCWLAQDRCASERPALTDRPDVTHPCACHFASTRIDQRAYLVEP